MSSLHKSSNKNTLLELDRKSQEKFWDRIFKRPCFGTADCPEQFWEPYKKSLGKVSYWKVKCPYSAECFSKYSRSKGKNMRGF